MHGQLALLGGQPVLQEPLPPTNTIGEEEKKAVLRVMERGVLSEFVGRAGEFFLGGVEVKEFESFFQKIFQTERAVSFNSATTALEAAVVALQLPPGSEVIVPPYTMTASVMAIVVNNLVPVFADVEKESFCLDPVSVRSCVTEKTRAIMSVNLFGGAPQYDALFEVAREHHLAIIEDNAQAAGGRYRGHVLGTIGDIGVFSFNVHKTIQAGEGGVLVTNKKAYAFRAELKRNHGENVADDLAFHDIPIAGSNYRMTELHAAIATEQLKKMAFLNAERQRLAVHLTDALSGVRGITPFQPRQDTEHVYYVYPLLFDAELFGCSRERFVDAMKAEGFALNSGYVKPIYLLNFFHDASTFTFWPQLRPELYEKGRCPVTEELFEKKLLFTTICRYPLTETHIDLFVEAVKKVAEHVSELKQS